MPVQLRHFQGGIRLAGCCVSTCFTCHAKIPPLPVPTLARSTPVGAPLLRSDPSAVPQGAREPAACFFQHTVGAHGLVFHRRPAPLAPSRVPCRLVDGINAPCPHNNSCTSSHCRRGMGRCGRSWCCALVRARGAAIRRRCCGRLRRIAAGPRGTSRAFARRILPAICRWLSFPAGRLLPARGWRRR